MAVSMPGRGKTKRLPDPTAQLALWIRLETVRRLRHAAIDRDMSYAELTDQLLTEGLDRLDGKGA